MSDIKQIIDNARVIFSRRKTIGIQIKDDGTLLVKAPVGCPKVVDSIVVHELCHRRHMNHSKEFYDEIYRVYPDYDKWNKWLKDNGGLLIKRMLAAYSG